MQQIVDLQNSDQFQALNVQVISIARDSVAELAAEAQALGIIDVPVLSDPDLSVSADYVNSTHPDDELVTWKSTPEDTFTSPSLSSSPIVCCAALIMPQKLFPDPLPPAKINSW